MPVILLTFLTARFRCPIAALTGAPSQLGRETSEHFRHQCDRNMHPIL